MLLKTALCSRVTYEKGNSAKNKLFLSCSRKWFDHQTKSHIISTLSICETLCSTSKPPKTSEKSSMSSSLLLLTKACCSTTLQNKNRKLNVLKMHYFVIHY